MRTLNLGILAHVDAGKTSLTERLLYAAGVIDEIGRVDDGNTQTDSLALERRRGITIKSAVVSFAIRDVTINLIDTPGHPDFIAEVERVLSVLDGAILVISAVEGVQGQTRVLTRVLQRLRIPTILFVNKIDRGGAQHAAILAAIGEKLTPTIVPMGSVRGLGTHDAEFQPYDPTHIAFTAGTADVLMENDDALLAAFVDDETTVSGRRLRDELVAQSRRALVHAVFFGSAITGAGVDALTAGIIELLPVTDSDAGGPVAGSVFKVDRGPLGEKIAYARMTSGTIRTRDRVQFGRDQEQKVTAIRVFDHGADVPGPEVAAGRIAKLWGLDNIQVGDSIGAGNASAEPHHFAPPTLESVVAPRRDDDRGAVRVALARLAEQDPLINLRQDDARQELFVSLYGEVQKEVIQETLRVDFGLEVEFRDTTTICIERTAGRGTAVEVLGQASNPFLATVGLRVEPAPIGSGIDFRLDVELTTIPLFVYKTVDDFKRAIEDTVRKTLQQGLFGWELRDCTVTMTHSGYTAPATGAGDFRKLTPLVLMRALTQAGTVVCEPVHRFHLEGPADSLGPTLRLLAPLRAVPQTPITRGSSYELEGDIPAANTDRLQRELLALTHGEGAFECAFDNYRPVRGPSPTRRRTDDNPIDRKEYLLHVLRRI